jgi:glucose 1-dehydrogenase
MAREGAAVVVNDRPDNQLAQKTADDIVAAGNTALAHPCDIGDLASHRDLIAAAVKAFGRIDILVNNAGIQVREPFLQATQESWAAILAVNLQAPFFLSQIAARHMAERQAGKIVNISSIHDSVSLQDSSIYCISKGGMGMLTKALAFELAAYNINVNAISPGAIRTDMNEAMLADCSRLERTLAKIPLGRIGQTEDLVGAAVFLASSESNYVTGATLYVDGGILLQ